MNREQRRQAQRDNKGRTRPRSPHKRAVLVNPIDFAIGGASKIWDAEKSRVMRMVEAAIDGLRTGKGTYRHWQTITSIWNVLRAIDHQGVVRVQDDSLQRIEDATRAIYHRASGGDDRTDQHPARWDQPTLHASELDALRLARDLYRFCLNEMTQAEYERAYELAIARVRTGKGIVLERDISSLEA